MEDMQGIRQYIEKYGAYSFEELPVNEIDALIFSQLSYIDFKDIADGDSRVFLSDSAVKYYSKHSDEENESLIGINAKALKILTLCAKTNRFAFVELCNYVNYVNCEIDKQFSALCFVIDKVNVFVSFRGTDVTVTGVKESAMLSYMFPVPAQIEALHYFQESAMVFDGNVYVCGHSKGGNLAVFAVVNCSNSLKKHIAGVYEFDAPGFPEWFFDRYDYKQIEDRIFSFTPESSIIGRMLYHNKKPVIVESVNNGLKQHQVSSWVIENGEFATRDSYDKTSDYISDYVNDLIDYVGEDDLELFFNTLEYVAEEIDINDFYDLKRVDFRKISALIDTFLSSDEKQRERFKDIIKRIISDFTKDYLTSMAKSYIDKFKPKENA